MPLLPAFGLYLISMAGEVNRLPFDLPEAEGELVGGYMTEYSSMKFAWFFLAEYINMLNVSAVATTLFFGGFHAPWHGDLLNTGWWGVLWFGLKLWFFMFLFVWARGTLLRFRYDQFMRFGWKWLIPTGLVWIVAVSVVQGVRQFGSVDRKTLIISLVVIAVVGVARAPCWSATRRRRRAQRRRAGTVRRLRRRVPCPAVAGSGPAALAASSRATSGTLEVSAVAVDAPVTPGDTAEEEDRG